jgi:UDP-3-O-[3-hydroxymyristoyl] glucosamine N-acyltransferase
VKKKLVFLGHGTNIKRLIDVARDQFEIIGIVDDNYFGNTDTLGGLPIIGSEKNIAPVLSSWADLCFFVASPGRTGIDWSRTNSRRDCMIDIAENYNLELVNLIHTSAIIPDTTKLGKNIFVGQYTVLQNYVTIEDYAFVKEQVCIAHDCVVKKNANISSQAYLGANVVIGENSYIGIKGAVIASGDSLVIGKNCFTHPGSIVMKNLADNTICTVGGKIRGVFSSDTI